jgi:DNA-directed RNA polymerase I subunit RPA1
MVQKGLKATNSLVILNRSAKNPQKQKQYGTNIDEGIVADVTDDTSEEGELVTERVGMEIGGTVETEAVLAKKRAKAADELPQRYVSATEVHASLTLLFKKEAEILTLVYNHRVSHKVDAPVSADMFFIYALAVPPNKYRPEARTGDGEIAEAAQNSLYKLILTQCDIIGQIYREISSTGTDNTATSAVLQKREMHDLMQACVSLQDAVNSLIDRDRNPIQGAAGKKNEDGIKQKLEKKEGLFRKNMMGKRVNFAARSVISPDPNIETNEIGVPPVFAKKLTYPEPVTNHNFYDLKEAVLNGVEKWPGAAAIENENGQVINLRTKSLEERRALANQLLAPSSTSVSGARGKKVHRHLNNGDIVLMNRQPTLHKPSIMGHRARVLPGEKTIRMHYANCNTYNADFDGDEMNMHFPQNEIARAEALQIADTDHQYLVATSGKPLRGLIQDHISMGVWMTNRDTFFDRESYQQLLYSCLRPESNHTTTNRIETVAPAIIKPRAMWTGKQIISTILKNIKPASHPSLTLMSKSSTAGDSWGANSEEGIVIFKDGELLCGILDKSQLGASGGGLVHSIYEVYGHTVAGRLLGILGRLLTKFLHMRAFTCGVEDLLLTQKGNDFRKAKLREANDIGFEVAAKYVGLGGKTNISDPLLKARLEEVMRDNDKQAGLDGVVNSRTRLLTSELIKECMPAGLAKPFPKNHMQTMTISGAKGSGVNASLISCNLGQQVLEGRRVPTMVSGKTLPCFKPFETSVRSGGYITDRFLTGIRPQEYFFHCMAGREGLIDTAVKTSRSGYLQRCLIKGMEGLRVEYDNTVRDSDGSMVQFLYGEDGLDVTKQKHLTEFKFITENIFSFVEELGMQEDFDRFADDEAMRWNKAAMREVRKTGRIDAMDPVLAHYSPSRHLYSTSEAFAEAYKKVSLMSVGINGVGIFEYS